MFVYIYYSIVIVCLILYFIERIFTIRIFQHTINFSLIFVILLSSFRSDSVDFQGYINDYSRVEISIFDFVYTHIVDVFHAIRIPYNYFLFLQSSLFLYTLYKYCQSKSVDFTLVLLLYVTHFFVIRDLSQSRIAFAFSFYLLFELNDKVTNKFAFALIAVGIHFSILPIFIFRFWVQSVSNKRFSIYYHLLVFVFLLILGDSLIHYFYFIDPRIEIYINWKEPGYGDVLGNYFFIYFLSFILFVNFVLKKLNINNQYLLDGDLVILFVYGIILGISFSSLAIFSTRITSIFATYYLFIISKWGNILYFNHSLKKYLFLPINLLLMAVFLILLLRNDNFEIIDSVKF